VFQGTSTDKLLKFVKCHDVILPYSLCVECTISRKGNSPEGFKDPKRLLHRLLELVKNGAYAGKSPARIVDEERSRKAAIESLIDDELTQMMRKATLAKEPNLEEARTQCEKTLRPIVDFVQHFADQYYKNICKKKNKEEAFRPEVDDGVIVERLSEFLKGVDEKKDVILDKFPAPAKNPVFKDGWEWQLLRLACAWAIELATKRNKSGPSFDKYKDLPNDIYDIYYVSHLSQAGGLLTNDGDLAQLAITAFPDKDVFRSIDDVPFRYCTCEQILSE
jgi:hypothetical protein